MQMRCKLPVPTLSPVGPWPRCEGSDGPESYTDLSVRTMSLWLRLCPGAVGSGKTWKDMGHPTADLYYLTEPLGYVQLPHLAAFLSCRSEQLGPGLACLVHQGIPWAGRAWHTEDSQYLLSK